MVIQLTVLSIQLCIYGYNYMYMAMVVTIWLYIYSHIYVVITIYIVINAYSCDALHTCICYLGCPSLRVAESGCFVHVGGACTRANTPLHGAPNLGLWGELFSAGTTSLLRLIDKRVPQSIKCPFRPSEGLVPPWGLGFFHFNMEAALASLPHRRAWMRDVQALKFAQACQACQGLCGWILFLFVQLHCFLTRIVMRALLMLEGRVYNVKSYWATTRNER